MDSWRGTSVWRRCLRKGALEVKLRGVMDPQRELEQRLLREIARASHEFRLIEPGDRIAVAVSGGKDSHALLRLLHLLRRKAPFGFEVVALTLDQGQPGFRASELAGYFEACGYPYRVIGEDTFSLVRAKVPPGKSYCALCSRLRRGILYNAAVELGATKLALGHHADDAIETLLLNLFFAGQLKSMPPRLRSDDGRNVVIRPLIYCWERDLAEYARGQQFPIVPCGTCTDQPDLERPRIKALLRELAERNPHVHAHMLAALGNVRPTHLMDRRLWQKLGIHAVPGDPLPDGADDREPAVGQAHEHTE
jgi:tRNA 2-thiocytidine biosynthesis protein TtcA